MTRIAVVADDLIWSSRLADAVREAGAEPRRLTAAAALGTTAGADFDGAIVDAALPRTTPESVVAALHAAGLPILAVADHDDVALRKRLLAAGADRVLAYRKLYETGPATVAAWLQTLGLPAA